MTEFVAHPVADLFPMLAADELAGLAADIKARGLMQPILLDREGRILDGRNRLAACRIAGVDPRFADYEGDDAEGVAWGTNVRRRNLTKAQTAVLAADRFADKDLSTRVQAKEAGVSQPMIVWSHAVRRYQDLHDGVLLRGQSLSDTYAEAQERDAAEACRQEKVERLRTSAADLLSLVDDERMSVDDAVAALDAREEKSRQDEEAAQREAEERASEEERAARQLEQERKESLDRDRERIRMVITGWSTVRDLILPDPDGDRAAEIVAGLGENDRLAIKRIVADITE